MKLSVFGATGMVGSAVVAEALARGHQVVAASRCPGTADSPTDHVTSRAVDVAEPAGVGPILAGADVAVLAIRLAPGQESRLASLTRSFLDSAADHGTRVLVVGGSAPLHSPSDPDRLLIDDPEHVPPAWQAVARASLDQFRACQRHTHGDWVYLSPPAVLEPGERTGIYQRGTTTLITDADGVSRITAPDLAIAVLDELENPGSDRHFTVAH